MEENMHYSELKLEQLALGEIDADEAEGMTADPGVGQRLSELKQSNECILERYPANDVIRSIRLRLAEGPVDDEESDGKVLLFQRPAVRGVMLLAAAMLLVFAGVIPTLRNRSDVSPVRIKGLDPAIHIYRKSGEEAERLDSSTKVRENDLVQIAYVAATKSYGAIVSIDGSGAVTMHYPYTLFDVPYLSTDGEVALEYSYQLDDAPNFERFFFVTSDREFSLDLVVDAAESLARTPEGGVNGTLSLPRYIEQISVTLIKEVSR